MNVFAKFLGAVEILIALFAAYLGISMTIGFFGNDRFAGEWGALLIPIDLAVAAAFGWAGFVLLRRETGAWKHQLVPAIVVAIIAVFIIRVDSV